MLKRFLLFIFCFSFTIIFIFPSTGLADVCNSVFWSTATSVDIKALSREDLEINECHQFVLLDVIRTKTPLNIALLNSQDSSVVGTYIERLWAIGQSFDLLDSNIEHLFIGVVITEYNRAFTHFEWVEAEIDNTPFYQRISSNSTLYKIHDAAAKRFRLWGLFMDPIRNSNSSITFLQNNIDDIDR